MTRKDGPAGIAAGAQDWWCAATSWMRRAGAALLLSALAGGAGPRSQEESLAAGERVALARLKEIRAVAAAYADLTWPGFDAVSYPVVLHQPGAWAVAAGFPQPPSGFQPIEGVRDGDRQIYRAASGSFHHEGGSPALVGGTWSIVVNFDEPEPLPGPGAEGRPPAEESLAGYFGDAFLLHLMAARGADRPRPDENAAGREAPEATALAAIEHRLLLAALRMRVDEKTRADFDRLLKQYLAVRRARFEALGPAGAAREASIEMWDGLRAYNVTLFHRHASSGAFEATGLASADPTSGRYTGTVLSRLQLTNAPLFRMPTSPIASRREIASRASALTFLMDMVTTEWRKDAIPGDRSLADLLERKLPVPPEEREALLGAARDQHGYDLLLDQARRDLIRMGLRRKELTKTFSGGGGLLTIRPSTPLRVRPDPGSTPLIAGEGIILYLGSVSLEGERVAVSSASTGGSPEPLMVVLDEKGLCREIRVTGAPAAGFRIDGRPIRRGSAQASLGPGSLLDLESPRIRITGPAEVQLTASGDAVVTIP